MPQHNPEDRVRVRNIVDPKEDDIQTMWITRYKKIPQIDANGVQTFKEIPYEREIEWNFRKGFLFFWGGKVYVMKHGEEKVYSRFLADHCVKHMTDYILTSRYKKTKKLKDDGTYNYDPNILNNENLKKQLKNEIIVGVEEWYEGNDDDFDTLLARQFGGDVDGMIVEKVDKEDFELSEVDQTDRVEKEEPKKAVPQSNDAELQKMREEADEYAISYSESDTVTQIRAKILKEMNPQAK